ncbi:hypothetical protein B0H34DRAFT_859450 [Crassisporium funariophilum]|nr:hypothetical protein B0H34DRAFT_859450 [Crassisporium funariophilum]
MFARAWCAHPASTGWIINTSQEHEIAAADLVLACATLITSHRHHQLRDPKVIIGAKGSTGGLNAWSRPAKNQRRLCSNGHRVLSLPLWLYCNDTSGSQSKKWNKHNSFLFMLAGLLRQLVHRESNIHFLSTSNLAPPSGDVGRDCRTTQKKGIWAWDCEANERVLLISSILAMLGDNPMQSEFACHIGLRGRKFCQGAEGDNGAGAIGNTEQNSDVSSVASDASMASDQGKAKKAKRSTKKSETMMEMVQQVTKFMKVYWSSSLRQKLETQGVLRSHFTEARRVGGNAMFKRLKTLHGIKDTFQALFLDRLFDISTKCGQSKEEKEKAMCEVIRSFPNEITSPVWRIRDFDPHSDTPVEILHVILLGFIKYFWRDAIHRLKPEQKGTLISRLSSFDTSGLIAQVAPFVLYDLLEKDLLDCWNAIGILVPLVWQPHIEDIERHIKLMESAIDLFLDCTCRVTPRWFNKPKFHIILHLPNHVKCFGPAMLFAMEGFESFNAIIRSASIHSNCHAPSRDIAHQMAKGNRVCHLLSGGKFLMNWLPLVSEKLRGQKTGAPRNLATWMEHIENPSSLKWRAVGLEPLKLLDISSFGERLLGLGQDDESEPIIGLCSECGAPMEWANTKAAQDGFLFPLARDSLVYTPAKTVIANGDLCRPVSWVIYSSVQGTSRVGRVIGLIQVVGSIEEQSAKLNFLIVAPTISTKKHDHYWMPRLQLHAPTEWECVAVKDVKCTVNVQHNCVEHLCTLANSRVVFQEQEATENFHLGVRHIMPNDFVLNTAQMRDAKHILPFRPPFSPLDQEQIVLQAAKLKIVERKKKKAKQAAMDAAASSAGPSGALSASSSGGRVSCLQRVLVQKPPQPQPQPGQSRCSAALKGPSSLPTDLSAPYAYTHPPPPLQMPPMSGYGQLFPLQQPFPCFPMQQPFSTQQPFLAQQPFLTQQPFSMQQPSSLPPFSVQQPFSAQQPFSTQQPFPAQQSFLPQQAFAPPQPFLAHKLFPMQFPARSPPRE